MLFLKEKLRSEMSSSHSPILAFIPSSFHTFPSPIPYTACNQSFYFLVLPIFIFQIHAYFLKPHFFLKWKAEYYRYSAFCFASLNNIFWKSPHNNSLISFSFFFTDARYPTVWMYQNFSTNLLCVCI